MRASGFLLHSCRLISGDLYGVLGVARTATAAELRRAYRKLALAYHPDRAGPESAQVFARIAEAYSVLGRAESRSRYDASLPDPSARFAGGAGTGAAAGRGGYAEGTAAGYEFHASRTGWNVEAVPSRRRRETERPIPNLLPRLSGPIGALTAAGIVHLAQGTLELRLTRAEARSGGTAAIVMRLAVPCPTCGGVATPRGVWCRRCEHAGHVTDDVLVCVGVPPEIESGATRAFELDEGFPSSPTRVRYVVA